MQQRLKQARPDILIIALLFAIPLLFYLPQTLGGKTLLPVDTLYQFEPFESLAVEAGVEQPQNALLADLILENYVWKTFVREQFFSGDIPLWQPYILGGTPFLAAGQSSALYPFNALFLFMPIPLAYGWYAVSQLWVAGIAMFIFARVLGLKRFPALVSAIAYQMSGFFLVRVVFTMIIATAVWLPLLLACIELTIRQTPFMGRTASLPWVVLGGITLGVAALAGHAEALYFNLLVMAFYAAWRLLAELIARRSEAGNGRRVLFRGVWLLALVLLGLALGAAQLVPGFELASQSARIGRNSLPEILSFAYPARHVLAFFMPNFYGSPVHHSYIDVFTWQTVPLTVNSLGDPIRTTEWGIKNYVEGGAYMGLLPLLLALLALLHWVSARFNRVGADNTGAAVGHETAAQSYRLLFAILAFVSVLIAFGTPLYAVLYRVLPFIDQSRAIFRWVWPLTLSVAVLAGFGAQIMLDAVRAERKLSMINLLGWGAASGGLLIVAAVVATRLLFDRVAGPINRVFEGLAKAAYAFPDVQAFYSYQVANALLFALMLILSGAVLLLALRPGFRQKTIRSISVWQALIVIVLTVDLAAPFIGFAPAVDPTLLERTPPSIAWLQNRTAEGDNFRIIAYEEAGADTMNANVAWIYHLQDASGYDSLIPGQYAAYMETFQAQTDLPYNRIAPVYTDAASALDSPMFDLLVKYVVTEIEIDNPKYELVYGDDAVNIYENLGAAPRVFTLPLTATAYYDAGGDGTLPAFEELALQHDVRNTVLLAAEDDTFERAASLSTAIAPASSTPGPAQVTVFTEQEIFVDTAVDEPSWLVVNSSYFPGWRAWVRPIGGEENSEQEIPVFLVNGNFRGVMLEPGAWTVRLKYSPDSFRFGAFTSFLTGLLIVFAATVWLWRLTYRETETTSNAQRIAKNSVAPILLNLFNKGILFALTFVSLRILGPEGAGKYRYAVVLWGWFEILANFGLNTYLTREVARNKDEANTYLVNTTLLRLALVLIGIPLLIGFVLVRQSITAPALDSETIWTLGLLYGGLFFSTISTGLTALFYAYEKAEYPAAIQTISAFLTATFGVLALVLGFGIIGLAVVSIGVNFVTLLIIGTLTIRLFLRPRWTFNPTLQREALGESFPLMLNHLLATLFFRIDVILLEALKGDIVVGWYSVVYTWVDTIGIIPSFFTQALFPVMSRQASEDRDALKRGYIVALKLMSLIAVPVAVLTTLLATGLINILGGPQYLPHGAIALSIFIWAMVIGWLNSVTQYVIIALNRQRTLTVVFAVAAVLNIVANLIFIPLYSYPAAAVITIISELALLTMFYTVIRNEIGQVNWAAVVGKVWLAGALMAGAAFLLDPFSSALAVLVGSAVYGGALLVIKPFTPEELQQVAPLIPERLRERVLPNHSQ